MFTWNNLTWVDLKLLEEFSAPELTFTWTQPLDLLQYWFTGVTGSRHITRAGSPFFFLIGFSSPFFFLIGFSKAQYLRRVLMIYFLDSVPVARYWTAVNWKVGPTHFFPQSGYDRFTVCTKASSHTVRSSASFFNFQHPVVSLRHPVVAYVWSLFFPSLLPYIFPSVACFRGEFLCKMWPIQLYFLLCYCMQDIPVLDCT